MNPLYCIYNAIRTPDGTLLWCTHGHDYKSHTDTVTGENYINDSIGLVVRRSKNKVEAEDLSVWVDYNNPELTPEVRSVPFWKSYGKNGEYYPDGVVLSLQDMETDHIRAILETQHHIKGGVIEKLFILELIERNPNAD